MGIDNAFWRGTGTTVTSWGGSLGEGGKWQTDLTT